MNRSRVLALGSVLALGGLAAPTMAQAPGADGDALQAQSRMLATEFGTRLRTALAEALESAGPAAAINVCKELAPQIAAELSRRSGAKISRTSLRVRNAANAAEPWQIEVLEDFEGRAAASETIASLEHFAELDAAGVRARFMRAIGTEGTCLLCHGAALAPAVADVLAAEYPHDRATGYALGDVRGAFSIVWPATSW
jgi:Protein of unknown function (DUF3365)